MASFSTPRGFRTHIFMELFNNKNCFSFSIHFKSSSSTKSRELRPKFVACSAFFSSNGKNDKFVVLVDAQLIKKDNRGNGKFS